MNQICVTIVLLCCSNIAHKPWIVAATTERYGRSSLPRIADVAKPAGVIAVVPQVVIRVRGTMFDLPGRNRIEAVFQNPVRRTGVK